MLSLQPGIHPGDIRDCESAGPLGEVRVAGREQPDAMGAAEEGVEADAGAAGHDVTAGNHVQVTPSE